MAAEQPFSESLVKQCIDSGLIDGEAMAADGSYIPANVSRESWINVVRLINSPQHLSLFQQNSEKES